MILPYRKCGFKDLFNKITALPIRQRKTLSS